MKLPNADRAVIQIEKLRDYCLNLEHRKGMHKARVFRAALNLTSGDARRLRGILLQGLLESEVVASRSVGFGTLYAVDIDVSNGGRSARVRIAWLIETGEIIPRLVSCYVRQEAES